jgi:hypothetical protein
MVGRLLTIGVFALSVLAAVPGIGPSTAQAGGWQVAYPGDEPFGGRRRPSRSLFSTYTSTAYDCGYYPVTKRRHGEIYVRWVRRCQLF